jgi:DNA processing protein
MNPNDARTLAWYRLFRVEGLGAVRLQRIHAAFRRAQREIEEIFRMRSSSLRQLLPDTSPAVIEAIRESDPDQAEGELADWSEQGIQVIHLEHAGYPALLRQRLGRQAPALLFCKGYLRLLQADGIAVVGARKASPQGLGWAGQFAGALALAGWNVISGFARGIDLAAHQGALRQDGTTSIVLSMGLLDFGRQVGREEFDWERNGLAVSQFHPGAKWQVGNAMARNRTIVGLARAVIVVESGPEKSENGKGSGTFATAQTALRLRVPLFVVDPQAFEQPPRGNAALLEDGGRLLDPADGIDPVLRSLQPQPAAPSDEPSRDASLFDE